MVLAGSWGCAQALEARRVMPRARLAAPGASQQPLVAFPSPQAVLAAAIIVNLKGMLMQFKDIPSLWKANQMDLVGALGDKGWDGAHGDFSPSGPCRPLAIALLS